MDRMDLEDIITDDVLKVLGNFPPSQFSWQLFLNLFFFFFFCEGIFFGIFKGKLYVNELGVMVGYS